MSPYKMLNGTFSFVLKYKITINFDEAKKLNSFIFTSFKYSRWFLLQLLVILICFQKYWVFNDLHNHSKHIYKRKTKTFLNLPCDIILIHKHFSFIFQSRWFISMFIHHFAQFDECMEGNVRLSVLLKDTLTFRPWMPGTELPIIQLAEASSTSWGTKFS